LNKIYYLVRSGIIFFRKNSNFLFRIYVELYLIARKVKNKYDIKNNIDVEKAFLVKRAYDEI